MVAVGETRATVANTNGATDRCARVICTYTSVTVGGTSVTVGGMSV